jgi:putative NADPH-quinone reductase
MRIYVLYAHPDTDRFGGRLATAYEEAALAKGHELRRQNLFDLSFDPVLRTGLRAVQPLEVDLIAARANLDWCERLVLFYPVWWGNVPALLKGFFDRTLYSEITYHRDVDDPAWSRMLDGKSAHIITTSDAPISWLHDHNRDSDINAVRRGTLEFCGMKPVKVTRIGRVKDLSLETRERWISRFRHDDAVL